MDVKSVWLFEKEMFIEADLREIMRRAKVAKGLIASDDLFGSGVECDLAELITACEGLLCWHAAARSTEDAALLRHN